MPSPIEVRRTDDAITISFTRADKRNALDTETSAALREAFSEARDQPLPVVLRSATAGMFVAGTDLASLGVRTVEDSLARINQHLFQQVHDHPWPTIACVDGWALGGGCELALACDFRISTGRAQWGLPEVRLGLIPSGGALVRLQKLIGEAAATDLVMTGRRIDGINAHKLGLVQRLAEDDRLDIALDALLADLAATVPAAVRLAKEAMRVEHDRHRLVDALAQALCIASTEAQSRIDAMLSRSDKRR